ncbi:AMP-binding protein [Spirulina sp. CS-785/01]|uniref:AMP-dependent synthetase/ligase n=1 Tax=Spirulina sp. CS-785/01 TaxID=3021716 RepID=UPI0023305BED|nr:AMP-binding protein [Spirulina sp. CS-785/01]MDB9315277.1 AMP-binding protein [Spirulina sp. CS-785/01]
MHKIPDYSLVEALPDIWERMAEQFGDIIALCDSHSEPETRFTYGELYQQIQRFAAGLQGLGMKPEAKVALFADNSPRWFIADQGSMMAGATNVVRSGQADRHELLYIYENSDSTSLIVQDLKTLDQLRPELDDLAVSFVVLLSDETVKSDEPLRILSFQQLMALGESGSLSPVSQNRETLATLLYTSGTTGKPKGVMLTHGNLLHQVMAVRSVIAPEPGDRVLSILPSWHAYERSVEYFLLAHGASQYYTNLRSFKNDLKTIKPHFMVGVPRLWESIYDGVQKQFREQPPSKQRLINFFFNISNQYIIARRIARNLSLDHPNPSGSQRFGAKLKATLLFPLHQLGNKIVYQKVRDAVGGHVKYFVSGGGSLARHIDTFYEITRIPLIVGYGLTETAPIATVRNRERNLRGASGQPLPHTEIRIVDPNTWQTLPNGEQGLVLIRGPQVMQGYYKNPEATEKVIDEEGWFNSGDLGMLTHGNNLVLTGRAKDTIVLSNGENIEPQPIEDVCIQSPYVNQMMLVGQDKRVLGALIVPELDALKQWVKSENLDLQLPEEGDTDRKDIDDPKIMQLFRSELQERVKNRPGYCRSNQIGVFRLILEPFSMDNGLLTQTLKMRRPVITERYQEVIEGMF